MAHLAHAGGPLVREVPSHGKAMDQWPVTAGKFALATHRTAPILAGMQTMGSVTTEAQEVPSIVH